MINNFDTLFAVRSFDEEKLLSFGFKNEGEKYVYLRRLSIQPFEARIIVHENKITADGLIWKQEIFMLW